MPLGLRDKTRGESGVASREERGTVMQAIVRWGVGIVLGVMERPGGSKQRSPSAGVILSEWVTLLGVKWEEAD